MHWDRARASWREWDEAVRAGRRPADILPTLSDEQIIDLLMSLESERKLERDVLATEAHNRLVRRRRALRRLATEASEAFQRVRDAMARAWPEVEATAREAQQVLKGNAPQSVGDVAEQTGHMARLVDTVRGALIEATTAADRLHAFEAEVRRLADLAGEDHGDDPPSGSTSAGP